MLYTVIMPSSSPPSHFQNSVELFLSQKSFQITPSKVAFSHQLISTVSLYFISSLKANILSKYLVYVLVDIFIFCSPLHPLQALTLDCQLHESKDLTCLDTVSPAPTDQCLICRKCSINCCPLSDFA